MTRQTLALILVTLLALCADGLMDMLGPGAFLTVTLPVAGVALALAVAPEQGHGKSRPRRYQHQRRHKRNKVIR